MTRARYCIALAFGALLLASSGFAEEASRPGHLLARTQRARLDVVLGRIRLTKIKLGRQSTLAASNAGSGIEERLTFSAKKADSARLCYQYLDASQQLIVDMEQAARLILQRLPRGDSDIAAVRLQQPLYGDLVLTVEHKGTTSEVAGDTLWHLMLAEPEICGRHLIPVLQSLRTDWHLDRQAQRVEAALLTAARRGQLPDTARMNELVMQLGHPHFSRRQAAHRELRQLGQTAATYLDRLDEQSLDVEQRTRVRQIRRSLQLKTGDTPARVASWLADDRAVWLSLAEREDPSKRQLATMRLEAIAGHPLALDPTASLAERRAQIHRLRAEWGLDYPILADGADGVLRR